MMDEQAADLKKRCATWEHEFAVSKETNCELQLCVRKKVSNLYWTITVFIELILNTTERAKCRMYVCVY